MMCSPTVRCVQVVACAVGSMVGGVATVATVACATGAFALSVSKSSLYIISERVLVQNGLSHVHQISRLFLTRVGVISTVSSYVCYRLSKVFFQTFRTALIPVPTNRVENGPALL